MQPQPGDILEIEIETIAQNGKGKGRCALAGLEKHAFFVEATAPGDRVKARVATVDKRYVEADLLEVLAPGPDRVAPACPHFAACGGCQLMHLTYPAQLTAKLDVLRYILRRRGFDPALAESILPSPRRERYRVRNILSLTPDRRWGMLEARSHRAAPIASCRQMDVNLETAFFAAEGAFAALTGVRKVQGVVDPAGGEVYFQVFEDRQARRAEPSWLRLSEGNLAAVPDAECELRVGPYTLRYAPDCFTQVNPEVNEALVEHVAAALAPDKTDRVLELYAGIGNFTLPVAAGAKEVTAVEWPRAAIYARRNAVAAGLANVEIIGGEVRKALADLGRDNRSFELALLDPPREGVGQRGIEGLVRLRPLRIVYVSCDPLTLIADLEHLRAFGYQPRSVRAFDMFPQTFHFESVAVLERGDESPA